MSVGLHKRNSFNLCPLKKKHCWGYEFYPTTSHTGQKVLKESLNYLNFELCVHLRIKNEVWGNFAKNEMCIIVGEYHNNIYDTIAIKKQQSFKKFCNGFIFEFSKLLSSLHWIISLSFCLFSFNGVCQDVLSFLLVTS